MDIVGINFADTSIEAVQAVSSWLGGAKVRSFNRMEIPAGVIENGSLRDETQLVNQVRQLLTTAKPKPITSQRVACSIPESQIFSRVLSFPLQVSLAEIHQSLQFQLPAYVPFEANAMYYDALPLGEHNGQTEVLAVALDRKILDAYVKLFDRLRMRIDTIELESISSSRAVMKLPPEGQLSLLLDIGSRTTIVSFFSQAGLCFTFNVPVAGALFTEQIAKTQNITIHQAEKIKCQYGFQAKGKSAAVSDVLRAAWQPIITKIKEGIDYIETKTKSQLASIVLIGGSAQLPGLTAYLREQFNVETSLGSLLPIFKKNSILQALIQQQLMYADAAGLAAGPFKRSTAQAPSINFFRNKKS